VATLRADLAAARISAAKKEAELRQLRRQVAELRRATEAKEVELLTVRIERDRLLEMRNEAKAKQTESRPTGPAPKATQAKLRELESALVALSSEVAEIQKGLVQVRTSAQAKHEAPVVAAQTRRRTVLEPVADAAGRSSEPPFQVLASPVDEELQPIWLMIKRGDTLWRIARRYGLTVRALKEANGLDSDLIRIGQSLVIPATASSQ
jgi:nucleoid-associated protein YgaU